MSSNQKEVESEIVPMFGSFRKLVKYLSTSSAFYTIAIGIEALVPLILLPFLTRQLRPEEYGIWILFVAFLSFMHPILSLTLQDAVRMQFYELKKQSLVAIVQSSFLISSLLAIILFVAVVAGADYISAMTRFPADWLWSVVLAAYFYGLFSTILSVLQFRNEKKKFIFLQCYQMLLSLVLSLALVLLGYSWQGVIIAKVISLFLITVFSVKHLLSEFNSSVLASIEIKTIKKLLLFGVRYLPAGILPVLIPLTDRLFVARMVDVAETSFFGIGGMFGSVLLLVIIGFIFSWQPVLFKSVNENFKFNCSKIRNITLLFYIGLPVIGVSLITLSKVVAKVLVGPDYDRSGLYIQWMIVAVIVQGYFQFNQVFLLSQQRIAAMSLTSVVAIILNAVFNWFLIDRYGGVGAAWGTIGAFLVATVISGALILWIRQKKISEI